MGSYAIVKNIGEGAYGKVKLAYHKTTNKQVAIKVMHKDRMQPVDLERVKREIEILRILDHHNIAKVRYPNKNRNRIIIIIIWRCQMMMMMIRFRFLSGYLILLAVGCTRTRYFGSHCDGIRCQDTFWLPHRTRKAR